MFDFQIENWILPFKKWFPHNLKPKQTSTSIKENQNFKSVWLNVISLINAPSLQQM